MQKKANDEIAAFQRKNRKLQDDLDEAKAAAAAATAVVSDVAASESSKAQINELKMQLEGVKSERDVLNDQVTQLQGMLNSNAEDKAKEAKLTLCNLELFSSFGKLFIK